MVLFRRRVALVGDAAGDAAGAAAGALAAGAVGDACRAGRVAGRVGTARVGPTGLQREWASVAPDVNPSW